MLGFIDTMRAEGHAVESIIRVLREQGVKIAASTYRAQRQGLIAARTVTDAQVHDAVRAAAWTTVEIAGRQVRKLTPEGLYGRRKMTALIRRTSIPGASRGAVDRAMRALGLSGIRRDKGIRTTIPAKDGIRAGDLLNRDFTAPRPDHTWVMDFTYCRTWAGWVYVAFIVDGDATPATPAMQPVRPSRLHCATPQSQWRRREARATTAGCAPAAS